MRPLKADPIAFVREGVVVGSKNNRTFGVTATIEFRWHQPPFYDVTCSVEVPWSEPSPPVIGDCIRLTVQRVVP